MTPRRAALIAARGALLVGPTVLAFFSGGYFDQARDVAGLGAWLVVLLALVAGARLPRDRTVLVALAGLGLLAAWTLLSILWAPIAGNAHDAGQIAVMYAGALLASVLVFDRRSLPAVELVLAAGALIVIGYGLSERLLPGLLHFSASVSAEGRLEQPLTYWNAMGELAALGFVLFTRIAGDRTRPDWVRAAAAAALAPLGLGLYITFSRGALFACVAGLVALTVIAPRREQLSATLRALATGVLAALSGAAFKGITAMTGGLSTRERQGAITLVLLIVIAAGAAVAQIALARRERASAGERELNLPRRAPLIATAVVCAGLALAIVVGAHETSGASTNPASGATRLVSFQSNRYDYWSVALRAFAGDPVQGVGAGGWSVDWLRWRTVNEFAQDAHSLELQTLAELGLVGLGLLIMFFTGVGASAARALRATPAAAGPAAALIVYLAHSPLDWDWQMPAVTLVAIVLAGAILATAADAGAQSSSAIRGASRRKTQTATTQIAQ